MLQDYRELRNSVELQDDTDGQQELKDVRAKVRYTQLARSLKTYGITFFLVKVSSILKSIICLCVSRVDIRHVSEPERHVGALQLCAITAVSENRECV